MITVPEIDRTRPVAGPPPFWSDPLPGQRHPRLLVAAVFIGVLAAVTWSFEVAGLVNVIIGWAGLGVCLAAEGRRGRRLDRPAYALVATLIGTAMITTASWAVVLCWLAAGVVLVITVTGARSLTGMITAVLAAPFGTVVGRRWIARSVGRGEARAVWPVVRTVGLAVALVGIFGLLFASGDAVFSAWADVLVPRLDPGELPARVIIGITVTVLVISAVVLVVLPLDVERWRPAARPPVRRFEWLVPTAAVAGVFVIFLLAQARALFGGPAYLASLGLSHASYVHQGFGQLIVATALVLVVVGVAARRAAARTAADRAWRRGLLGGLCGLALVVAASALHRLFLYDQAYGATRLRLLVATFEVWVVTVLVLAATVCVRLRGTWVPRVAVLLGAVLLALLGVAGPDRVVAERNVDRFTATGALDWVYLGELSAEAAPALDRLPEPYRSCALAGLDRPPRRVIDLNLGALGVPDVPVGISCDGLPSR